MKFRSILLFLFCLFGLVRLTWSQNKAIASLESIILYQSSAEIFHKASVTLKAGKQDVILYNVSHVLDLNSIQIGYDQPATILSVRHDVDFLQSPVQKSIEQKSLEEELEKHKSKGKDLKLQKSILENTLGVLEVNKVIGGASVGTNVSNLTKMVEYYFEKTSEIRFKILDLTEKDRLNAEQEAKLANQIQQISSKNQEKSGRIIVTLIAENASSGTMRCSYLTLNAHWTPFYEIKATGPDNPIQIIQKGKAWQQTGLDWNQVKLSLSTATPNVSNISPTLSPWFLTFNQYYLHAPANQSYANQNQITNKRKFFAIDGVRISTESMDNNGVNQFTSISENVLAVQYDIDLPYDIPSDGNEYLIHIKNYSQVASFKHLCAPKVDPKAYLTVEITDWQKWSLLAGEANIISEGSMIGKTWIQPNQTSDTLLLTLGNDKRVVVKRNKLSELCSSKFLTSFKKETYVFEITVRNNRSDKILLSIKDQIPLTTDKDIEIEDIDLDKGELNHDSGIITWKKELVPGETKKIRFGYTVKFPKDKVISNL